MSLPLCRTWMYQVWWFRPAATNSTSSAGTPNAMAIWWWPPWTPWHSPNMAMLVARLTAQQFIAIGLE